MKELEVKSGNRELSVREEQDQFALETGKILSNYLSKYSDKTPLIDIIPAVYPVVRREDYEEFLSSLNSRQRYLVSLGLRITLRESLTQLRNISRHSDPESYEGDTIQTASDVTGYVQTHIVPGMGRSTSLMLQEGFRQFTSDQNNE